LNDDNPAVRIMEDGNIMIYGTPWSGKTPCYRNVGVLLNGLVRLRQAPENQWKKVLGKEALLSVLPSCTAIRWNRNLFDQMLNSLEKIITNVNVGQLSCLPDQNAAYLCSQELIKNNKL
jgi:Cdc6-like AAA superfamily ATPase